MASPTQTLDEVALEVDELLKAYKELQEIRIPGLKEAINEQWFLVVEAMELGALVHYDRGHQHEDRKRVVPLKVAIDIMREYEEALVERMVKSPESLLWGRIYGIYTGALAIVKLFIDLVYAIFTKEESWFTFAERFFVAVLKNFVVITALAELKKATGSTLVTRHKYDQRIRKAALPQRDAVRYARRKVAR